MGDTIPLPTRAARLGLGLLDLAAVGCQLAIHVGLGASLVFFFSYFTILSNIFAFVVFLAGALVGRGAARSNDRLRAAATTYMAIVGIVFSVLLRDADLGALRPWINVVTHYVMPVAVVLDWLVQPPGTALGKKDLLWILVFPTCYLAFVLIRGRATGWYPYPFFNPAGVGGYGGVAAYAVGVAVTLLAVGWSVIAVGNRRRTGSAGA